MTFCDQKDESIRASLTLPMLLPEFEAKLIERKLATDALLTSSFLLTFPLTNPRRNLSQVPRLQRYLRPIPAQSGPVKRAQIQTKALRPQALSRTILLQTRLPFHSKPKPKSDCPVRPPYRRGQSNFESQPKQEPSTKQCPRKNWRHGPPTFERSPSPPSPTTIALRYADDRKARTQ